MKTNDYLNQFDKAIQFFINHKDNEPDTEFCKNVDQLINLKAEIANGAESKNGKLPIPHVVGRSEQLPCKHINTEKWGNGIKCTDCGKSF